MQINSFQNKYVLNNAENAGWKLYTFTDIFSDESRKSAKIKRSDYLKNGNIPIVDQGKSMIGGYSNNDTGFYDFPPFLIFGDHTRVLKYIDYPSFIGADGVKLLKNKLKEDVLTKYVYYFLRTIEIPDVGYNRHFKFLKEVIIPIPTINVQQKIINTLDKIHLIKEKRQQQIETLSNLKQSLLHKLYKNLQACNQVKLSDVLEIDTVIMKDYSDYPDYYVVGIDNIKSNTGELIDLRKIKDSPVKGTKHYFHAGHILYSKIRPYLNKVATPHLEGVCSTDAYPLLVNDELVYKNFITALLQSHDFVEYAVMQSSGANIPRINRKKLLEYKFLLPSMNVQGQFSKQYNAIDQKKLDLQNGLKQIEYLNASIINHIFSGRLFHHA